MIAQRNHFLWHKLNAALRVAFLSWPAFQRNSILVNEYPKSGGTWLTLMLRDLLGIPFARNRLPFLTTRQIFHGHYLNYGFTSRLPTILLWRDGRDAMVSLYYHSLFYNDVGNKPLVDYVRKNVSFSDYSDVYRNLPEFLTLLAEHKIPPGYSWAEFVRAWKHREDCVHVNYESLFDSCEETLRDLLDNLNVSRPLADIRSVSLSHALSQYTHPSRASCSMSDEPTVPFVRKGGHGGWVEHFSMEAAQVFQDTQGMGLIDLGYEPDHSWVANIEDFRDR